MSGFELRNAASNGDGVKTACPTSADALAISLSMVRIAAAAAGPPAARLATGIHVSGYCGAGLADVTVEGAATGIRVESAAPAVETTASSLRVTGSTVAGVAVSEGRLTVTGGSVDANAAGVLVGTTGSGAPTFSPTGTAFSGNAGDAIYVARGTLVSDGCPYANNGTHVHAQPVGGASVNVTVQNSSGAAKMTGATNSAFRLLAMGAGSTLVLSGNEVSGNNAIAVRTTWRRVRGEAEAWCSQRRFPPPSSLRGNPISRKLMGPSLVAASAPDRHGPHAAEARLADRSSQNTFTCYDTSINSGSASTQTARLLTLRGTTGPTNPPSISIDFAGSGSPATTPTRARQHRGLPLGRRKQVHPTYAAPRHVAAPRHFLAVTYT